MNKFHDVIDGGNGADTINLTSGSDAFFLHDTFGKFHQKLELTKDTFGKNYVSRISSIEIINAGNGDDLVDLTSPNIINPETTTVFGEDGDDTIWSNAGNDFLYGGSGDDVLFGGVGTDTLIGGSGSDVFEFTIETGNDVIKDYSFEENDILKFT